MTVRLKRKRGITVWLVTWEHQGEHARPRIRIAALFNQRCSNKRVRAAVEWLYANEAFSLSERAEYAAKRFNPYPAEFSIVGMVSWSWRITCGHNPHLYARIVDHFVPVGADDSSAVWEERGIPDIVREHAAQRVREAEGA